MSKVVEQKSAQICEYCDKEFAHSSSLQLHQSQVLKGQKSKFECMLCDFTTTAGCLLKIHTETHRQGNGYKCPNSGCKYSNSKKLRVRLHHNSVHGTEKGFHCPISPCQKIFEEKASLTAHMKNHRKNLVKTLECDLCPHKTVTTQEMKKHKMCKHSEERRFKCQVDGCKFAGKMKEQLMRHMKFHKEKKLKCPHPDCEYKITRKDQLEAHMKVHVVLKDSDSKSKSERKHKCKLCEFSTPYTRNLRHHMRVHTNERPYKCKFNGCSYAAKTSTKLTRHRQSIHEKLKPYKCPFCPYDASVKQNLLRHQSIKHPHSQSNLFPDSDAEEEVQEDPLKID